MEGAALPEAPHPSPPVADALPRAADGHRIYGAAETVIPPEKWRDMKWCLDNSASGVHGFAARALRRNKVAARADEEIAIANSFITYVAAHVDPAGEWWLAFSANSAPNLLEDWLQSIKKGGISGRHKSHLLPGTLNKYLLTISALYQWADDSWTAHPAWQLQPAVTQRMKNHVCHAVQCIEMNVCVRRLPVTNKGIDAKRSVRRTRTPGRRHPLASLRFPSCDG